MESERIAIDRIVVPPRLRVWQNGEWSLYFDPHNFVWARVNESGRYILERLRKYRTADEVAGEAEQDFGLPPADARGAVAHFVDGLVEAGFLHHNRYREREWEGFSDLGFPQDIYLHMTNACNLKCPYCYNKDDREFKLGLQKQGQFAPELSTDEYKHLIDRIAAEGVHRILFTGGEPLMRDDLLELAAHARSLRDDVELEILTNAILIKDDVAEWLCDLFDTVTISLDGHERHLHEHYRGHNTFGPTVAGVRRLLATRARRGQAKPRVVLVPALTERNIGFMKEIYEFALDELGTDGLAPIIFQAGDHQELSISQIPPIETYAAEVERTRAYLRQRQARKRLEIEAAGAEAEPERPRRLLAPRNHCGVGHGEISVDPSGFVYPCQSLHFDEFVCGNVRQQDIQQIFADSPVMRRTRGTKVEMLAVCSHCDLRHLCNGGCRATAYNVYRNFEAHNEIYCRHLEQMAVDKLWGTSDVPMHDEAHACI